MNMSCVWVKEASKITLFVLFKPILYIPLLANPGIGSAGEHSAMLGISFCSNSSSLHGYNGSMTIVTVASTNFLLESEFDMMSLIPPYLSFSFTSESGGN